MGEINEYLQLRGLEKLGLLNEEGEKRVDEMEVRLICQGKGLDIKNGGKQNGMG